MNIDEKAIPAALIDAYCKSVDSADPTVIVSHCRDSSRFFQGCRAIPQNAPFARQRMRVSLKSDRVFDPSIRTILQDGGLYRDVVIVLSVAAMEEAFPDLAAYFGETDFLAAALLDPREEIRKIAHNFIQDWDGLDSHEAKRQVAVVTIRRVFSRFFASTKDLGAGALSADPSIKKDDAQLDRRNIEKALESAQSELARQKQVATKEQKRLQEKLDQGMQSVDQSQRDLDAVRSQVRVLKVELSNTQNSLSELQTSLEQRVAQGVELAVASRFRTWLEPVRAIEEGLAEAKSSEVLTRAAKVLERQRAVDRSYGNRAELTSILDGYCRVLSELKDASVHALRPLPELLSTAAVLEREIADLERRLGVHREQLDSTESSLLARINSAQSHDDLSNMRRFVQQSTEYGLLNAAELHRLYSAINYKADLLYDSARILDKDSSSTNTKAPFNLRRAAATAQPFTLFIDGHNVLFSLVDALGQHFDNGIPGSKARTALANSVVRVFDKPGQDVILYFDGNERTEQSLSDQVRVFYSGGTGDHRADDAILKHMDFWRRSGASTPLWLVTKDVGFAREAGAIGASIMHPEEFSVLLELAVG